MSPSFLFPFLLLSARHSFSLTPPLNPSLPQIDAPFPSSFSYDSEWNESEDPEFYDHHHHPYYDDEYGYGLRATVSPEQRSEPCPGPHSTRNVWGDCFCDRGYYYGDPLSSRGCWNCQETCDLHATCVFPGVCRCDRRYRGDGLTCDVITPQILAVAPLQVWSDEATQINISYLWDVDELVEAHPYAMCRIGNEKKPAISVTNDTIVCVAAPRAPQVMEIAIAFEGSPWSTEEFQLVYKNKFHLLTILPIVGIYALAIGAVAVCIWRVFGTQKKGGVKGREEEEDEQQPFLGVAAVKRGAGIVRKKKGTRKRAGP